MHHQYHINALTPVANLPPVSTTLAVNFPTGTAGVVDTGGIFSNSVNNNGGKFAAGINDSSSKFATGVNGSGSK